MSRTYTQDFKKDALSYVRSHRELTLTEAAANLGIPKGTLYGWGRAEHRRDASGEGTPVTGNLTDEEKEMIRLKRELRDTKDALEILKKAISILGD